MGYEFIKECFKRFRTAMIISLAISVAAGVAIGLVMNRDLYRSSADFSFKDVSTMINQSFDENYYYLFYKYFRSQNENIPYFYWSYFENEDVYSNAYESISAEGYDITYKEFRNGISTYFRRSSQRDRITVVFPDKGLSESALDAVMLSAAELFNDDMTGRAMAELEHRQEKIDEIEKDIIEQQLLIGRLQVEFQTLTKQVDIETQLALISNERNHLQALDDLLHDNNTQITRLRQVADFDFWNIYELNTVITERGALVDRNAWGIGLAAFMLACSIWITVFYMIFSIGKLRRSNEKT